MKEYQVIDREIVTRPNRLRCRVINMYTPLGESRDVCVIVTRNLLNDRLQSFYLRDHNIFWSFA
jgi:hypothetical protein